MKKTVHFEDPLGTPKRLITMALEDIPNVGDTITLPPEVKVQNNVPWKVLKVHRDLSDPLNPTYTVEVA